jgi:hypothetical protein
MAEMLSSRVLETLKIRDIAPHTVYKSKSGSMVLNTILNIVYA